MSRTSNPITTFSTLKEVAEEFRKDLKGDHRKKKDLILLFAHNRTGKTRLSMEFKNLGKTGDIGDTLYFNAFTEDLFTWNNDLRHNRNRALLINQNSRFFRGLQDLEMETRIGPRFQQFVDLNFFIDYTNYKITFSRNVIIDGRLKTINNIKISRGEENIFRWCFYLAICELAIDEAESYKWVKYFYIDDPISSLDENNAIAVAVDLANLIRRSDNNKQTVISTHHSLFYNVMFNELSRKVKNKSYFLYANATEGYALRGTGDTPFFHHVAILSELKQAVDTNQIYTYHFNALRSILEKTAGFLGYDNFSRCIQGLDDEVLFERALNLMSHGKYSLFDPKEMGIDNKNLFKVILDGFLNKYEFHLPEIFTEPTTQTNT